MSDALAQLTELAEKVLAARKFEHEQYEALPVDPNSAEEGQRLSEAYELAIKQTDRAERHFISMAIKLLLK